ncbi:MAG TPA: VWA domain-containing protein [Thermoanaerobaculia bacterium]|jgi:VWFA-related protein|nr:VWA domain-containing protein [Thermoanaerobaculia bacterium]
MRRTLAGFALALLLVPSGSTAQTFSESTDVVVVEVPVQVIGADGAPVRGLKAEDFEVYEGRRKQPLVGFEVLDLQSAPAAGPRSTPPMAARRHFLLLFDVSFSTPKSIVQARGAAREMVDKLHPSDLVGVASYSTAQGAKVLLGFTGDRGQILGAIDRLGLPQMRGDERPPDPLGLIAIPDILSTVGKNVKEGVQAGAAGAAGVEATEMEVLIGQNYSQQVQLTKERAAVAMTRSYAELARMMSSVRGRKHILLFSEGFDNALLTGTADVDEQNRMASDALWNVDSTDRFGSSRTVSHMEEMLEEFRRADCIIQAVDIGGLRDGVLAGSQWTGGKDSLFLMAKETGGELFENHNQLGVAVAKVLERTSVTYVLAFQPDVKRDGSYHRMRVELKNAPKGARLVHRPGYYAPRPYDQQSPFEKALVASEAILTGEDQGRIPLAVLSAPFPTDGPAYVPVLIEVDGPGLLKTAKGGSIPLDIYAYAFDSEGRVRDFFSQTVGLDVAKVGKALEKGGLKFFGHLDLPPGPWSVRVLVRNGATGAMGMKAETVAVPDLSQAEPVLLPAFFPEPPGRWLIVREAPRQGDREVPYPFMAGEEPYVPASLPALDRGKPAEVSLIGYKLRPGDLKAEARILTADGREAGTGEIAGLHRLGPGPNGSESLEATFAPPTSLPAGEYVLMVVLTDSAGGSQASVTPFVVRG